MKVLIVGDKPSSRMKKGAKPFEGAACEKRLKSWIKRLGIVNYKMFNSHTYEELVQIAANYYLGGYSNIITLGKNAEKQFKDNFFGIDFFPLPHPSGLNRQINNKKFINQKLRECRKWLREQDLKQNKA